MNLNPSLPLSTRSATSSTGSGPRATLSHWCTCRDKIWCAFFFTTPFRSQASASREHFRKTLFAGGKPVTGEHVMPVGHSSPFPGCFHQQPSRACSKHSLHLFSPRSNYTLWLKPFHIEPPLTCICVKRIHFMSSRNVIIPSCHYGPESSLGAPNSVRSLRLDENQTGCARTFTGHNRIY